MLQRVRHNADCSQPAWERKATPGVCVDLGRRGTQRYHAPVERSV